MNPDKNSSLSTNNANNINREFNPANTGVESSALQESHGLTPPNTDFVQPITPQDNIPRATLLPSSQTPAGVENVPTNERSQNILKQWVSQAESIVTRTAGDPYQKSELISKLKAEYNYGRNIAGEASEDRA